MDGLHILTTNKGAVIVRPDLYHPDLAIFIKAFGDKRIAQVSYDLYKKECACFVFTARLHLGSYQALIGLSMITVEENEPGVLSNPHASITVVHSDYRGLGIGTALVKMKQATLTDLNVEMITEVSETNEASKAMLTKAGLIPSGNCQRTAANGRTFNALSYRKENQGNEEEIDTSGASAPQPNPEPAN